jgi:peroxiredoxin
MIIDHGKVTYAAKEPGRGVTVSGAEVVLANLQPKHVRDEE